MDKSVQITSGNLIGQDKVIQRIMGDTCSFGGGEHEIAFVLLTFTPILLTCNTSGSCYHTQIQLTYF